MLTIDKTADSSYPLLTPIKNRWSPRAFAAKAVETEKLLTILEAARWAASSNNQQPWRFVVTQKGETAFERLVACLREGNALWAQHAPVLVLTLAKTMFEARADKPARENRYAFHDLGLAVGNLLIQASELGLYAHQMAGFYPDKAREAFTVPTGYEPATVIALGYLGDPENLPDDLAERERAKRNRKPLEDIVFSGRFGQAADFL